MKIWRSFQRFYAGHKVPSWIGLLAVMGLVTSIVVIGSSSPSQPAKASAAPEHPSSTTSTTTTEPPTTSSTAAPTATAPAASGGNCTTPTFTTREAQGTRNTDPNDGSQYWWVNNDAWSGSHGPQSIAVCNQSSWAAVSNQSNHQGQVETYPNTEYDVGGRSHPSTRPISGWHSITSSFSEAFPSAGGWDAAFDLWLNNWSTEIMVWNQWAGSEAYWYSQATGPHGKALSLDGVRYHFYNNGGELMFFRDSQTPSGSVDILAAFQWLVSEGLVHSTDVPTQLEYGVEVCYTSGSETFPVTGLNFNLS